jgi:hypothetical protein
MNEEMFIGINYIFLNIRIMRGVQVGFPVLPHRTETETISTSQRGGFRGSKDNEDHTRDHAKEKALTRYLVSA